MTRPLGNPEVLALHISAHTSAARGKGSVFLFT
jgi:hypothetical protein